MKKVKTLLTIGLAVLLILCMSLVLIGCARADGLNPKERKIIYFTKKTGVCIPQECTLLYDYTPKNFDIFPVPGRDEDYIVFGFENKPTEFLEENGFSNERSVNYEKDLLYRLMELSMAKKIPEEYMLDFDSQYFWFETKGIYFTYFTDVQRLIIFVTPY